MSTHEDEIDEGVLRPAKMTREEMRDEADAYSALAETLSKGKSTALPSPPFEGQLKTAVLDSRRFTKSAKQRQIRRLAQLLREAGSVEEIQRALDGRTPELVAGRARERANENWRARLLADGDPALADFIEQYPSADRRRMRQLMRQANRKPPDARSKKAGTTLIREIRAHTQLAASESEADTPPTA